MNTIINITIIITITTIIDMEILKDTQEFSKEDVALITKMFYKDAIKNRGGKLEWENLERMIDMVRIAKIRRILKEKEKEHKENNNNNIL